MIKELSSRFIQLLLLKKERIFLPFVVIQQQFMKEGKSPMKLNSFRTTKTGIRVYLRPVEVFDKSLVKKFLDKLSVQSLYSRFFTLRKNILDEFLQKFFTINTGIEMYILAIDQNKKEEVVGVGQFHICSDASLAEIALIVSDNYQNKGIGRELLTHMMQLAKYRELKGFEGIVQTDNWPMLRICQTIGFSTFEKTLRPPGVYEFKMFF